MTRAGILAIAGAFVLTSSAAASRSEPVRPDSRAQNESYDRLVGAYLHGDVRMAIAGVRALFDPMPASERGWLVGELIRTTPPAHHQRLAAALMVHSEIAFSEASERDLPGRTWFAQIAAIDRLYQALRARAPGTRFIREWYLLVESFRQGHPALDTDALNHVDSAVEEFPGDAEMLLACGSGYEGRWWEHVASAPGRGLRDDFRAEQYLIRAEDCLRESLRLSPETHESRLRLAHVLIRRGEFRAAAIELGRLELSADEHGFRYLRQLFQGLLDERRGRLAAAAAEYRAALVLVPDATSARVADEYLQQWEGERPDPPEVALRTLHEGANKNDPWWWYIRGQWPRFEYRLRDARTLVRR
jgi:tetratricopeptide (TPR) repeat protein